VTENGKHHSALPYLLVWVALLILTATTYSTGRMHLVTWALPLALTIAVAKSLLVILFFMHLWEQKGANRIVIGTSFVFVALIISLTVADVATRFPLATPADAPFGSDVPAQLDEPPPEYQHPAGKIGEPARGVPEPK